MTPLLRRTRPWTEPDLFEDPAQDGTRLEDEGCGCPADHGPHEPGRCELTRQPPESWQSDPVVLIGYPCKVCTPPTLEDQ